MRLFAGLGNPGPQYAGQRHNIGFMAVDAIAAHHGLGPWREKFSGQLIKGAIEGAPVTLFKPMAFMNRSGLPVAEAMRFFRLTPADLYVFHDELDLAPGRLRAKTGGGTAGHNGLRDIDRHIGPDFHRIRLGIGHPGDKALVTPHVLGDFAKADRDWLDPLLDAIAREAGWLAKGDAPRFMTAVAARTQTDQD